MSKRDEITLREAAELLLADIPEVGFYGEFPESWTEEQKQAALSLEAMLAASRHGKIVKGQG